MMNDLRDKADYVERILAKTKVERYFYLAICGCSAVFLLICASCMVIRQDGDVRTILPLFGSSGIITYSTGQILRVWSDAMKFANSTKEGGGE
jgi:hypothetical protein